MKRKIKVAVFVLLCIGVVVATWKFVQTVNVQVLNPAGMIAEKEKDLILDATLLMLVVIIPVFILAAVVGWVYRASNKKAKYEPDWDNDLAEAVWWMLPCVMIIGLSVLTWVRTHDLDPFKPLESDEKPITIQVVALQWKWLFIYPEQNIATVNFFQVPTKRPLNFQVSADAPMNSFWVPQLGGQIYAMPGMRAKLHLIADDPGTYNGLSAHLSGKGFAGMVFTVKAGSDEEFEQWVAAVKDGGDELTMAAYDRLVEPSENDPVKTYSFVEEGLFDKIIMKYMMPAPEPVAQP